MPDTHENIPGPGKIDIWQYICVLLLLDVFRLKLVSIADLRRDVSSW